MRLNCAIFDMDGTLLDSMWKWDDLGFEILRRHDREARADFRDMTVPMGMGAAAEYCVEAYALPCTPEDIVEDYTLSIWLDGEMLEEREIFAGTVSTEFKLTGEGVVEYELRINNANKGRTIEVDFDE